MAQRVFQGFAYRKVKISNLPGNFWYVTVDSKELEFRSRKALEAHLRTVPKRGPWRG